MNFHENTFEIEVHIIPIFKKKKNPFNVERWF